MVAFQGCGGESKRVSLSLEFLCSNFKSIFAVVMSHTRGCFAHAPFSAMGWLQLVGSFNLLVSFAKEPYKIDDILEKRPTLLRSLLIVATPYESNEDSVGWS